MDRTYKLIIWGPGSVGGYTLREALRRPEFEVVGVRVFSEAKDGIDIGELAGTEAVGIAATRDVDALIALDADCVIHTPQAFDPAAMDAEVIRLLESGKNVVSTAAYHYPPQRGEDYASRLEQACRHGNATLMAAGLHPPYAATALAMPLTGAMTDVRHIRLVEAADLARVLADMGAATNPLVAALGFGQKPADMNPKDPAAVMVDAYYDEIAAYLADQLFGASADQVRTEHELSGISAEADFSLPSIPDYTIPAGGAHTVLRTQRAFIGDHHFFTNEDIWYLGAENQYLGADRAPTAETHGALNYYIEITGQPTKVVSSVTLDDDITAPPVVTSSSVATLIQSIIPACHAKPGIKYRDTVPRFATDLRTVIRSTEALPVG
jgi:hypothetical protein